MSPKLIISLILAGLTALFIFQNIASVEIQFLFWSMQMSRALMMFLLLTIGVITGWLLHEHFKNQKE